MVMAMAMLLQFGSAIEDHYKVISDEEDQVAEYFNGRVRKIILGRRPFDCKQYTCHKLFDPCPFMCFCITVDPLDTGQCM